MRKHERRKRVEREKRPRLVYALIYYFLMESWPSLKDEKTL
jgi:hypothetical protein